MRLIGHDSAREEVVGVLQELGVLQITDLTAKTPDLEAGFLAAKQAHTEELEQKLNEIQYVLDFIARFEPAKKGLLEGFINPKATITEEELKKIVDTYDYKPVYERARALDTELATMRSELSKLEAQRNELLPWADVNIPIEQMRSTPLVAFIAGKLPKEQPKVESLKSKALETFQGLVSIEQVGEQGDELYVYAVMPSELEARFLKLASEYAFEQLPALFASLPSDLKGLPKQILLEIDRRIAELSSRREKLAQQAAAFETEKAKLQALYEHYHNEFSKRAVQGHLIGSPNTFVLEGWVRASDFKRLESSIRAKAETVYMTAVEPKPDERPPVALENRRWAKPVEFVVQLFGLPHHKELDPTPFVAPFFILFFGLAVSDAGVGLALLLLILLLKRKFKGEGAQKLFKLGLAGSAVAIIVGLLMGSIWGPQLPSLIPNFRAVTLDAFEPDDPRLPIDKKGIMFFLGLVMGLGYVHLLLANALEWYDEARGGRFFAGLWVQGSWLVLLLGLGLIAGIFIPPMMGGFSGLPSSLAPVGWGLSLAGVLMVAFLAGAHPDMPPRKQLPWAGLCVGLFLPLLAWLGLLGGPRWLWLVVAAAAAIWVIGSQGFMVLLRRLGGGLFRLYSITGYLGDVISYARIMAIGISTGLIGMTFNIIGFEVVPKVIGIMLPFLPHAVNLGLSVLIALIVLLVGHTLNLILSSMGAFVHSARLQYVEFFTKFFEAGGECFKPFAAETKFYELKRGG